MSASPITPTELSALNQGAIGEHWIDALDDGTHVLIRALQEQDREREFLFIKRLSATTRRARFSSTFNEPPLSLMDQLMSVKYPLQMAYVALAHSNGELREIGVARYAQSEGQCCEFAVVVADDWQQKGLGRLLINHLMDAARRNGFTRMEATEQATNYHFQRLMKKLGFDSHAPAGDYGELVHQCRL